MRLFLLLLFIVAQYALGQTSKFSVAPDWQPYTNTAVEKDSISRWNLEQSLTFGNLSPARFLSVDTLSDKFPSWTPYHYVHNNPIKMTDPTGKFAIIDDFLVGFVTGLIEGEGVSGAWDIGTTYAGNSIQMWSSFGRGDFGEIIGKFTWELPQQTLGVLCGHVQNMIGNINSVTQFEGATLVETQSRDWGAYTLGSIITAQGGTTTNRQLFMHEYGHYIQSQQIAPLYIPAIALPSLGSAALNPFNHNNFYTERWANENARKHFGPGFFY